MSGVDPALVEALQARVTGAPRPPEIFWGVPAAMVEAFLSARRLGREPQAAIAVAWYGDAPLGPDGQRHVRVVAEALAAAEGGR